ncbi:MAG: sulfatase family protein [Planctomycetota bacterium]|jgi:arylsulfatase A-like enzyme
MTANNLKGTKPNILWLCTDQQRWDTITSLGNKFIHTPNLDKLIKEGVAFKSAYCQSPICTPSRASFLTGMYPSTIRASMNGNEKWAEAAPLITKTLADIGYDCGLAGKLHLSAAAGRIEKRPEDDGYRIYHWSHHPTDNWPEGHDYNDWLKDKGIDYMTTYKELGYIPTEHHQTTWCAEKTIEFIKEEREKPWLFSFNCFDPHPPLNPPQEFADRYKRDEIPPAHFRESDLKEQKKLSSIRFQTEAAHPDTFDNTTDQILYWAQIDLIDQQIGRIIDTLEETGQRENTVIIFTSDHGNCIGDHSLRKKGCRFYEGLVRVPLIFSWPGKFRENLHSDALVELTDIVPTLLELTGMPIGEKIQGKSLLPILSGDHTPDSHRDFVRAEYYSALGTGGPVSFGTMIRNRRYKLVNYHGHEAGELFDLEIDPGEFNNLYDNPDFREKRLELTDKSFDSLVFAIDLGPRQVADY